MAIVVMNKESHKKYILLGTGFGAYKAVRPSFFGGNWIPHEEEGTIGIVAVCDYKGDIIWIESDKLQVIEVDGLKISELDIYNKEIKDEELNGYEICPACESKVNIYQKCCPECGLRLF